MEEHFPKYDEKNFSIRRKIVTGKMTILQDY